MWKPWDLPLEEMGASCLVRTGIRRLPLKEGNNFQGVSNSCWDYNMKLDQFQDPPSMREMHTIMLATSYYLVMNSIEAYQFVINMQTQINTTLSLKSIIICF